MYKGKKIAIIGAALFQEPIIIKAKNLGLQTHVFAWATGTKGEQMADCFYPISIREKEAILEKCKEIGIDGIASIASDLAMETVNYVAEKMNLSGNGVAATYKSTNKYIMRKAFEENGDPSPRSILIDESTNPSVVDLEFPLIVKPTDRSGSRGVNKVNNETQLRDAILKARECSFEGKVVVEEYVDGDEYSVEYLSYKGRHWFLNITEKITTGAPNFIEKGHREPAPISKSLEGKIKEVSEHALNTLELHEGAAHIEVKVKGDEVKIIEIGGRMGGDFIGSDLVYLSTGYDYVRAVIDTSLGIKPETPIINNRSRVGVNFIMDAEDVLEYERFKQTNPNSIVKAHIDSDLSDIVTDSSNRHGYYIFKL